jgi:hypothetical protein
MAITLQITDGTTTVDLSSVTRDYVPRTLDPTRPRPEQEELTESARVDLTDTTLALALAKVRSLQTLFREAAEWHTRSLGVPVYVKFRPDGSETLYRSELYAGDVQHSEDLLSWQVAGAFFEVNLSWTRAPYWEADSETELTAVGGEAISNHDDSGHHNHIDIDGALLGGVAPAGCRVEVTNSYATGTLGTLWIGVNAHKGSAMPTHVLEGEDSTIAHTDNADGSASNGYYASKALSGTSLQAVYGWTISATEAAKLAGHAFHLLLRTPGSNDGIYISARATFRGSTVALMETPEVRMNADQVQDLGVLQLPPYLESETVLYNFDVLLYARGANGATVYLDYLLLMPLDGWRVYRPLASGIAQNGILKDDSMAGRLWIEGLAGTQRDVHYIAEGEPLQLTPGQDHRLIFLGANTSNASEPARTFAVKVFYRPRRLTV